MTEKYLYEIEMAVSLISIIWFLENVTSFEQTVCFHCFEHAQGGINTHEKRGMFWTCILTHPVCIQTPTLTGNLTSLILINNNQLIVFTSFHHLIRNQNWFYYYINRCLMLLERYYHMLIKILFYFGNLHIFTFRFCLKYKYAGVW